MLSSIAEQASPAAIIVASSTDGKEIAGRLAVRLGSGVLADVIAVKEGGVGALDLRWFVHRRGAGQGEVPVFSLRPVPSRPSRRPVPVRS